MNFIPDNFLSLFPIFFMLDDDDGFLRKIILNYDSSLYLFLLLSQTDEVSMREKGFIFIYNLIYSYL